ncbi:MULTISPECIES: sugar phosphate isomerase/epimerase family protein [Streptomyces]|uniref:sugar phosphate isomerase/epimerase family protein n=1 Tax=Streptomyces TaxID=1883 RepID=UPI000241A86B|nr:MULTISPECIES: TIM barrel protein [Streptomyces]EHM29692.1 sugar phosphate isomerase/epimerase [Streptomyces sp. W007]WTD29553.1 sugar phosphate isomerase/epimerase [Streptomyces anulatus]
MTENPPLPVPEDVRGPVPGGGGSGAASVRLGICSVTFRHLPAAEVARRAAGAGLEVIEWGADVHAPPGEPEVLRAVRDATELHGLVSCSYGSYFHCLPDELPGFAEIARGAVALRAPRVRVWAGTSGSADVTEEERSRITAGLREAALIARDHGLEIAPEFHAGTLTDSTASTVRLLEEAGVDGVGAYWQPPQDAPDEEALTGLDVLADRVGAVHVFSWWPGNQRLPLAARDGLWGRVFGLLGDRPAPRDALLEFVPGDDPAVLEREAATLRRLTFPGPGRVGSPLA